MDIQAISAQQLDRVLGFFSRVETKAAFVFALDTTLLATTATNLELADLYLCAAALPAMVTCGLAGASIYYVYQCYFPHLRGHSSPSLIYFGDIARLKEADFVDQFRKLDEDTYVSDLLGQVWRNSEILRIKFDAVATALQLAIFAMVPWITFLIASTVTHAHMVKLP